jgi:hypothetical protein
MKNVSTYLILPVLLLAVLFASGCKNLTQNYQADELNYKDTTPWTYDTPDGQTIVIEEVTTFDAKLNQERTFAELEIAIDGTYDWKPENVIFTQKDGDRGGGFMFKAKGYSTQVNVEALSALAARDEILAELIKQGAVEGTTAIGDAIIKGINPASGAGDLIPAVRAD